MVKKLLSKTEIDNDFYYCIKVSFVLDMSTYNKKIFRIYFRQRA